MDVTKALEKGVNLERHLHTMGKVLIAYSGGVDSAFLAYAAHRALGEAALALIADSPSIARSQLQDAISFAGEQGIPLRIIHTAEFERADYVRNGASRCFHCKDELFSVMEEYRRELGFDCIAYGMNLDDKDEFRPGQRAAQLHHISAPLMEAELSKREIRELARRAGLRLWDKPASACLSSRIEYGRPVTREALAAVERGEEILRELGFRQFRVRHHGEIARIEIAREEMERAFSVVMADQLVPALKALGFQYVTLDCEAYRSGSMNALLPVESLRVAGLTASSHSVAVHGNAIEANATNGSPTNGSPSNCGPGNRSPSNDGATKDAG